jgi:acetyl-CoA C-acetyltransferase
MGTDRVGVLGFARTAVGRFGGALRTLSLPQLGSIAVTEALRRAGVDGARVDELALGVNFPGSQRSVARQVQLRAGIPDDRVSYTVDRACCSSLAAVSLASRGLRLGETRIAVSGGVENLSRVPYFVEAARFGQRLGDIVLTDQLVVECPHTGVPRAVQAADEAAEYGIGRAEQDEWALGSHQRYAAAKADGRFDAEIIEVHTTDDEGCAVDLHTDEPPRPDSTAEGLAALRTVNGSSTVTAGNAPDLSSGATALVLACDGLADGGGGSDPDAVPVAHLRGWSAAAGHPQRVASMPASAARLALQRTGLTLDDIELIEINEAFAAVPLVTTFVLADGDRARAEKLRTRTNVNGGSVAIGHPTGATAGRLVMTCLTELRRRGGGRGLVTICGGVGEAEAVVVEVLEP